MLEKFIVQKLQEMLEKFMKISDKLQKMQKNCRKYQKNIFIKINYTKIVGNA